MDKILSFLFGVKKSKFEITKKELEDITNNSTNKESKQEQNTINVDTTPLFKDSFSTLSDTIFKEATEKFKINRYNYWAPKYTSLRSYKFLSEQQVSFKRDFLYWITNEIIELETTPEVVPNRLKNQYFQEILNLLLRSNLHFEEKDFKYFMSLWIEYPTYITIGSITSRLREKSKKDGISEAFYNYLKRFLKSPRFNNHFYSYYKTSRNTIQKVLHTYTVDKDENQPLFLLVSDPFADYVNKFLKNSNQKEQDAYCQLLKIFETNKEFYNPFKLLVLVEKHIDTIGKDTYKKQVVGFIKKASVFKPKMSNLRVEKVTYNTGREVRYNCQYIKKENISILKSMILSIATFNNKKNAIPHLLKITTRSFSNANALRLGETSQSLGKLCIYTLAFQYDQKGKDELKKLYQETTYKGIKKEILEYSKMLEEHNGIGLI
ncbi:hypothetical protein SAMN04487910_3111 [Aquimarina amphilecti]|uniref:Uncharacterized protein n=1 Tax=Aquimarina amphilecti TaxID=1038014 RepID=A0A1H7SF62_AQUAM|nr:hypothetical protein [Aquimarina amphilecti]SEL70354.1 hypothetical protein SAMN04487910_3111 [Aquimarina amphilecti]